MKCSATWALYIARPGGLAPELTPAARPASCLTSQRKSARRNLGRSEVARYRRGEIWNRLHTDCATNIPLQNPQISYASQAAPFLLKDRYAFEAPHIDRFSSFAARGST